MCRLARVTSAALFMTAMLAASAIAAPQAAAYGQVRSLDVWQVGLSFNCDNPSACGADNLGGFWAWVQFNRNPVTGATDADLEGAFCGHSGGGGGAGAGHVSFDVTSWIIQAGELGGPGGPGMDTFWITGGTGTETIRGQTFTGPLTDDNGNPVSPSNPMDTNIPVAAGHYSATAIFGMTPPPGVAIQIQVAYKPAQ